MLVGESIPEEAKVSSATIGFSLAPRINAAGRMGCADSAVELLLTENSRTARELTDKLCELNRRRQKAENDTYEEDVAYCDRYIRENKGKRSGALVITGKRWHAGIIGIIASRLSERYACPVFLISLEENGIGRGSARSFYGVSIMNVIKKAAGLFESWGGHEFAAGFTIKEENIPALKELLETISCELDKAHIRIDVEIDTDLLSDETVSGLDILEPYGAFNPIPTFLIRHVQIDEIITLGWGKSLRMTVRKDGKSFPAFYFGMNMNRLDLSEGDTGDIVCRVEPVNTKGGGPGVRLVLLDLRPEPRETARYEREMELFRRFASGEEITRNEARGLIPTRKDFVALLRYVSRNIDRDNCLSLRFGALCRRICRGERLEPSYARLMVCLEILAEMGRLRYNMDDDIVEIELLGEKPVNISASGMMMRLRAILGGQ